MEKKLFLLLSFLGHLAQQFLANILVGDRPTMLDHSNFRTNLTLKALWKTRNYLLLLRRAGFLAAVFLFAVLLFAGAFFAAAFLLLRTAILLFF
ncbi:MAG: hypothetical protein HYW00_01850 [Candidatus Colwellbacteria bacterium]|nr:hypothetical protein [Candidatus Colwellbacteria bacterium]